MSRTCRVPHFSPNLREVGIQVILPRLKSSRGHVSFAISKGGIPRSQGIPATSLLTLHCRVARRWLLGGAALSALRSSFGGLLQRGHEWPLYHDAPRIRKCDFEHSRRAALQRRVRSHQDQTARLEAVPFPFAPTANLRNGTPGNAALSALR